MTAEERYDGIGRFMARKKASMIIKNIFVPTVASKLAIAEDVMC